MHMSLQALLLLILLPLSLSLPWQASTPITDACALHAIKLISTYLRVAVRDGSNLQARDMMAYAEFLAGMAFNSASLGYVHAMAHQLGGFYNLPHGVCNAVLLPVVQEQNAKHVPVSLSSLFSPHSSSPRLLI